MQTGDGSLSVNFNNVTLNILSGIIICSLIAETNYSVNTVIVYDRIACVFILHYFLAVVNYAKTGAESWIPKAHFFTSKSPVHSAPVLYYLSFFLKILRSTYPPTSNAIDEIRTIYITYGSTLVPKK